MRKHQISFLILFLILPIVFSSSSCNIKDSSSSTSIAPPVSNSEEDTLVQKEEPNTKDKETAKVTRIIDGDTVVVFINGKQEKVRLIGIDTPEHGRPYFEEARTKTKELVLGKTVKLEKDVSERDKYGRLLRYLYAGNLFVNAELVKQGYAMVYTYPPDVKYADYFLKLQREAREKGVGLWAPPQKSIQEKKPSQQVYYVASRNRESFHYPWCTWAKKISPYNLKTFSSREEAIKSGHRPCKVCNP